MKCLKCGRFCKNITAKINGLEVVAKVEGECAKCGLVDLTKGDWDYEDFDVELPCNNCRLSN